MLTPRAGDGFRRELFAVGLGAGGPVAMGFGPSKTGDKALYYTTFAGGRQVRRIVHTAGNLAPVAAADTVGANYGSSLTMYFDVSGSRDPDDDTPLTYVWDFGDDGGAPTETTDPATSHTYKESEKFTVTLAVRNALGEPTLR